MAYQDVDQTLPTVATPPAARTGGQQLLLTIIFHPDVDRIGQAVVVPRTVGSAPWVLGRAGPVFAGADSAAAPLADPHVSRYAVEFEYGGAALSLQRPAGSSRCLIANGELVASAELSVEDLRRGVPLMLSHCIVLMLRLTPGPANCENEVAQHQLIGDSAVMRALREQIADAANSGHDVLIRGESGSGKELVARALHAAGGRADRALISVNMAAIPEELASAALFGSARGAFTGAERSTNGYFREAAGGTLFLDEIGDTAESVQPQLLRALQEREIQCVGGGIEHVDVSIISATDASLAADSGFKSALRHRLGAMEIVVPPLRDHPEDIGQLLMLFLAQGELASIAPHAALDQTSLAGWAHIFFQFARYNWPGNVRELGNLSRHIKQAGQAPPRLSDHAIAIFSAAASTGNAAQVQSRRPRMQDISDEDFNAAMEAGAFEPQAVARALQVSRTSVYRRIQCSSQYQLAAELPADTVRAALSEAGDRVEHAALALRVSAAGLRLRLRNISRA